LPYAFYERTADGMVRDITDELPFDVPETWEWVRLHSLGTFSGGKTPSMSNSKFWHDGNIPWVSAKDMKSKSITSSAMMLTSAAADTMKVYEPRTIVMVVRSGILKRQLPLAFLATPATINQDLKAFELYDKDISDYIYFAIKAFEMHILFELVKAVTTVDSLKFDEFRDLLIPIPPPHEQQRIVQNLFRIEQLVEKYDTAEQKLTTLNGSFPDALKKSILQAAVQGKLVEQDPHDEPTSVLLERIRAEREQLIRDKKIKRSKNESVIFRRDNSHYEKLGETERCIDNEIPFDVPDNWAWVRLENLCKYIQRGKSPKYSDVKKYPIIAQKCNQWSGFSIEKAKFIEPASLASYVEERIVQDDDLLWNSTGLGTLGRIAIYKTALNPYELAVADSHVSVIRPLKLAALSEYLYSYFANPTVQSVIELQSDGTTKQKELATSTIRSYLVPLPPIAEQRRIVARIESLLATTAKL